MKTLNVVLTDEEAERIETVARNRGVSTDELLHDVVMAYIAPIPWLPPDHVNRLPIIGIGASGRTDIASRFDEVLAETFTRFLLEEEVSYSEDPASSDETDGSHNTDRDQIGEPA